MSDIGADYEIDYIGLFVCIHRETHQTYYSAVQMYTDDALPENTPEDIAEGCAIVEESGIDMHLQYIDMYGIVVDGVTQLWEELDDVEVTNY